MKIISRRWVRTFVKRRRSSLNRLPSGVNFMEKTITVRRTTITFSIWDLGGQREFVNMLPLVCNDAVAILFMFDLSRKSTLNSVKEWYRQARGFNKVGRRLCCPCCFRLRGVVRDWDTGACQKKCWSHALSYDVQTWSRAHETHIILSQTAIPFLIGTKFDTFATFPRDEQEEITKQVCQFVDSFGVTHRRVHRRSDLREQCMHRSSSVQHPHRSMFKRSSR